MFHLLQYMVFFAGFQGQKIRVSGNCGVYKVDFTAMIDI